MLGLGLNLNRNIYIGTYNFDVQYYVRPAGTTYGDGSGTSYANAWSGFSSINWSLLENKQLNIFGTHNELLSVQQNNVTINSGYVMDKGIINGQSLRQCINITNYNNITLNAVTCNNGLLDNLIFVNSIGNIVNDSVFDTSTNQTIQTGGTACEIEFNNCTFRNGADDGISSHDENTVITVNNSTFENNVQGINSISSGIVYANDCNFINNNQDLNNGGDSQIIATRCTLRNQVIANSSMDMQLINCVMLSGETRISSVGSLLVSGCKFLGTSYISSYQVDINKVKIRRSYFEMDTTTKVTNNGNTAFRIEYCTFKHIGTTNTYAVRTGGTSTFEINNCNFIGNGNIGRAIQAGAITNVNNSIFQNLNLCVNPNDIKGVVTFNSCNTYANTTINVNQGGGTFTNINNITTNPLFTNISTLDFRLQPGSGAIGTGLTLTNAEGIETADWISTFPTIVTKNQGVNWNRGAYVN